MQFEAGKGFSIDGTAVNVDLSQLDDEALLATKAELDVVAEQRGLWVPEIAGSLAVATEVEPTNLREELLNSLTEGAVLYGRAIDSINQKRNKKNQIPVLGADEYRERAEDWLNEDRLEAAGQLPTAENRPRLLIPRLNRPITHEENLEAWSAASDRGLYVWRGQMKFLKNWTADQLSGFDPQKEDETLFEVIATAYDTDREGTVDQQKTNLTKLERDYPDLGIATIFEGVPLARRYKGRNRNWQDSYVRAIDLQPTRVGRFALLPDASVYGYGFAPVYASRVGYDYAARLRVG